MNDDETYPAPTCLRIEDISQTRVIIGWTPSPHVASHFTIQRRTGNEPFMDIARVEPTECAYSDTGLEPGECYTYRVAVHDADGRPAESTPVMACTLSELPAAPENLKAEEIGSEEVLLTWKPGGSSQVGFIVLRQAEGTPFIPIAQLGAEATSFTDATTVPGARYLYKVVAFNSGGNSAPARVSLVQTNEP